MLDLAFAIHTFKWVKMSYIHLVRDQAFLNIDLRHTHFIPDNSYFDRSLHVGFD